jgi:hypothetical protein
LEFNLFTAGYAMSRQPAESDQFKEGIAWQWQDLDVCVDEKLDRTNPDFAKYMRLRVSKAPSAPAGIHGLLRTISRVLPQHGRHAGQSGDWQTARKIYANATHSREYQDWKHRDVLEQRIRSAQANVAEFNAPVGAKTAIMINCPISCLACHQQ